MEMEEVKLSKIAEKYKKYYEKGFWTKKMLMNVVGKKITKEEYEIIIGETYE